MRTSIYNHHSWEVISPSEAIARVRKAGVLRVLVSSSSDSSDDGAQKRYAEASDLIVPELPALPEGQRNVQLAA